jgi:hypothetical protein
MPGNALPYGHRETAAHYIPQNIVDYHIQIQILKNFLLFKKLNRRDNTPSGAANPGLGPAGFHAVNAVISLENYFRRFDHGFFPQSIQDCGNKFPVPQGIGGIAFGIAAELHYPEAQFGKGRAEVRGCGGLANAAFPIYGYLFYFPGQNLLLINTIGLLWYHKENETSLSSEFSEKLKKIERACFKTRLVESPLFY